MKTAEKVINAIKATGKSFIKVTMEIEGEGQTVMYCSAESVDATIANWKKECNVLSVVKENV